MERGSSRRLPRRLGEYRIVRLIAMGGMGAVHEVVHERTGAAYAAKTILKADDPKARARFQREAELLARCDRHPGVVAVHTLGAEPDGTLYLILDLVQGEGLDRLLERERRLEPGRAAGLARDVALALAFVHARGIVHRDVKPSNVLLDSSGPPDALGRPRLTDFGLATARDVERLTRTGQFVGTVAYVSPEQAGGRQERVGPWSDVFSLGAVLFHLLAGEPPVAGDSLVEILRRIHDPAPVRDVRELAPEVPPGLAAVVARALAKDPERRYRSADELAHDLERFLSGAQTSAAASSAHEGARRRARRGLVAVLLLALAVGVAAVATALVQRDRRARAEAAADEALDRARAVLDAGGEPAAQEARLAEARARVAVLPLAGERARRFAALADEALAAGEVARGEAASALARLEAVPGAPATLGLTGRIARARARTALGNRAEAAADLAALAAGALPPGRKADVLEALGDALADPARAQRAYASALDARPRAPLDVRLKRGRAAALAGDDRTALADLAVIVSDLAALPEDPAANARLAPFAASLYRRGLAPGANAGRERDLEAAWRLGPPPDAATARALVEHWGSWILHAAGPEALRLRMAATTLEEVERATEEIRRGFVLVRRVLQLEPGWNPTFQAQACNSTRTWLSTRAWSGFGAESIRIVDHLRSAWPDHPTLVFSAGWVRQVLGDALDGCSLLLEAADLSGAVPVAGDLDEGAAMVDAALEKLVEEDDRWQGRVVDLDRLDRLALRSTSSLQRALVARAHARRGRFLTAERRLAEARALPLADAAGVDEAVAWVRESEGRSDEAVALLRQLLARQGTEHAAANLAEVLTDRGELEPILRELAPPGTWEGVGTRLGGSIGVALGHFLDPDDVDTVLASHELPPDSLALSGAQAVQRVRAVALAREAGVARAIDWARGRQAQVPRERLAWLLPALIECGGGDPRSEALAAIPRILSQRKDRDPFVLLCAGLVLAQLGRAAEAKAVLESGLLDALPWGPQLLAPRVLQAAGDAAGAVALARRRLADPRDPRALRVYLLAQRRAAAPGTKGWVASREEIIRDLGPRAPLGRAARAVAEAHAELGRMDDLARIASDLAPASPCRAGFLLICGLEGTERRARALADAGSREDARRLVVAASRAVPRPPETARVAWLRTLLWVGDLPDRVLDLVDPERTESEEEIVLRGEALARLGRDADARALADSVEPRLPAAAAALRAALLALAGDRAASLALVHEPPPGSRAAVLSLAEVVQAHVESGRGLDAVPELVDARTCRDGALLGLLARALVALGRRPEAEALESRLASLDPAFREVRLQLRDALRPGDADAVAELAHGD